MSLYLQFKNGKHRNTGQLFKRIKTNATMNTSKKVRLNDMNHTTSPADKYKPTADEWDMEHPISFRYTKTVVERYNYVDNGEQTMQRSNITITVEANLPWENLVRSKIKLDDGEMYMLLSVTKNIDGYYSATNILGASNNFTYTLILA